MSATQTTPRIVQFPSSQYKLVSVFATSQAWGAGRVTILDTSNNELIVSADRKAVRTGMLEQVVAETFIPSGSGRYSVALDGGSGVILRNVMGESETVDDQGRTIFKTVTIGAQPSAVPGGDYNDLVVIMVGYIGAG